MERFRTVGLLAAAAAVSAGTVWAVGSGSSEASSDQPEFKVSRIEASWAFNRDNAKQLAGASDALLIVEISQQLETEMFESGPETYFDAEVVYSFKGDVAESATVPLAQEAGYDADSNTLYLFEGEPLLEPGRLYLVAARYDEDSDAYVVIPGAGTQDVTDLNPADIAAYKTKYTKAVNNEVSLPADSEG